MLFLHGLRAARVARTVRSRPIEEVIDRLCRLPWLATTADPQRAALAARRSCARLARWAGGLDSCLTRSLVAGSLLRHLDSVVLEVGFRPGRESQPVEGHAWLTVGGAVVEASPEDRQADEPYAVVRRFDFRQPPRGG